MDEELITKLIAEIRSLDERLRSVEIEQRRIREDILSGSAKSRMKKRILEQPNKNRTEKREKFIEQIKIEI